MRMSSAVLTSAALLAFVPGVLAQTAPNASSAGIMRTSDGQPDFSGFWVSGGGGGQTQVSVFQGGEAPRSPTRIELAEALPFTPEGRRLVEQYTSTDGEWAGETGVFDDAGHHSVPCGPESPGSLGAPVEIVQNPARLFIVYTGGETKWIRQVWIGREHPEDLTNYEPAWMGHSVGRWEGDTLVVDTVRMTTTPGHMADFDTAAPQGPDFRLIERISLAPDGRMHIEKTFEDPVMLVRPWTKSQVLQKQTNWDDVAFAWEISEQHLVCEGGRYPSDNDPY
jgi:hypothetical protein